LALEREDLVFVARALQAAEHESATEVAATKAAWPLIADGLPRRSTGVWSPTLQSAQQSAERLTLPPLLAEQRAEALTGPASTIAGDYRDFSVLAGRGWEMLSSMAHEIEHGSPQAATFARANSPLYVDSIYDAHFSLAQIAKPLLLAYRKLGGPAVFGSALTQAEVDALAQTYSEASDRLQPHVAVKLGS